MKQNLNTAKLFVPDNTPIQDAIKRTTHMAIVAHQDDIEIMAYDGILKCYNKDDQWFFGVVVTNGSGSAREGIYKQFTDQDMIEIRRKEQKEASIIGQFGALALLDYPSKQTKDGNDQEIISELEKLILVAHPDILYTHNLADKHDTHIGVAIKVIKALRNIPKEIRPKAVYGCEVWRNLDWMLDDEKVIMDVSGNAKLALDLVKVFDSQIAGGKRYDLATIGRRLANATYATSHAVDQSDALIYAMDLTPLIEDDDLDISEFVSSFIQRLDADVVNRIKKVTS